MGFVATVREAAANTPARRNRVVDLWRAVSILVVVLGHWTMAAVTVRDGGLVPGHLLVLAGWTHPLTWAFQVMPVFFLVGGYANGRSWRSARERATPYGAWLRGRARRLTLPVVPVLLFWPAAGWLALQAGVDWRACAWPPRWRWCRPGSSPPTSSSSPSPPRRCGCGSAGAGGRSSRAAWRRGRSTWFRWARGASPSAS